MKHSTIAILVVLSLIAAAACWLLLTDEQSRDALFNSEGVVRADSKYGVTIGEPATTAAVTLRRAGWSYVDSEAGGNCVRYHFSSDNMMEVFFDQSWRKTTLCIVSQRGHVVAVAWYSARFTPEL